MSSQYLKALKPIVLERMTRFEQFVGNNMFFFNGALDYVKKNEKSFAIELDKDKLIIETLYR